MNDYINMLWVIFFFGVDEKLFLCVVCVVMMVGVLGFLVGCVVWVLVVGLLDNELMLCDVCVLKL